MTALFMVLTKASIDEAFVKTINKISSAIRAGVVK
jgi:hypothetical protein